jgi:hypothetical protein
VHFDCKFVLECEDEFEGRGSDGQSQRVLPVQHLVFGVAAVDVSDEFWMEGRVLGAFLGYLIFTSWSISLSSWK